MIEMLYILYKKKSSLMDAVSDSLSSFSQNFEFFCFSNVCVKIRFFSQRELLKIIPIPANPFHSLRILFSSHWYHFTFFLVQLLIPCSWQQEEITHQNAGRRKNWPLTTNIVFSHSLTIAPLASYHNAIENECIEARTKGTRIFHLQNKSFSFLSVDSKLHTQ